MIVGRTYATTGRDLSPVEVSVHTIGHKAHLFVEWPNGRLVRVVVLADDLRSEVIGKGE